MSSALKDLSRVSRRHFQAMHAAGSQWNPTFSLLERVNQIDSWPYMVKDPVHYKKTISDYYYFMVDGYRRPFSYVHRATIERRYWPEFWSIDHKARTLILKGGNDFQTRSARIHETFSLWAAQRSPETGNKEPREEELMALLYPDTFEHVLDMDRTMIDDLGAINKAVHLVAYVNTAEGIRFWIPRRAMTRRAFPGKLDNTVAGCIRSGESPLDCVVREAAEEASFPAEFTRKNAHSIGTVTYSLGTDITNTKPDFLSHLLYVYIMDVGDEVVPKPFDGEAENYTLMSVDEVTKGLANDEFKSRLVMTWTAIFIHLGIISPEREKSYTELCTRIHRRPEIITLDSL